MKLARRNLVVLTLFYTLFGISASAHADLALANQDLHQALNELDAAKVYVTEASKEEPVGERVQFHYDWLLSDIDQVESGINEKFDKPEIEPRVIAPIKGDYLMMAGEKSGAYS